jgi:S1-C subfamily serine protease
MRRGLLVCLLLVVSLLFPISSANAAWIQYQSSEADTYNRPDLTAAYDITRVDFAINDTKPDEYWFFLNFAQAVTANQYNDGLDSWAGVFLDLNNDGKPDYSLETSLKTYEGNYYHAGDFVDRTSGSPVVKSDCAVQTWTNLATKASWIGFSIKKNCKTFGSVIGIRGYSDRVSRDDKDYDYAPDEYWTVNINGGAVTPTGTSTSTTITGQLPSVSNAGESLVTAPANQPGDLVALAAETTKSVVTILCRDGVGSGWSISATLSAANISNGYKSYIITNHHVIDDCIGSRVVTLVLSDQTRVSGYVYSWDEPNDVAGILTNKEIPPLNWRGANPQQGWWAGIIGSPLGFPGILTTGIVSSVNSLTFLGTTTAAINPGNSGGPVFDRSGRVIGLATAKYVNAESFGIFNGTPLLCNKIIVCSSTSQIWSGAVVATPTPTPTPVVSTLVISASNKVYEAIDKVEAAVADCNDLLQSKGDELGSFITSTIYGSQCDSLNQRIESVKTSFENTSTSGTNTSGIVSTLDSFTSSLNGYYRSIVDITDELEGAFKLFSDLNSRMNAAQNAISNNRDAVVAFTSKLKLLPTSLQSSIKKKAQYIQIQNGMNLERKFDAALETQQGLSDEISDRQGLSAFINAFKVFETRYKDFLTVQTNLEELDLLIPDYVCIKGKTSVLIPKTGKCAKGYTKTATFEDF